jgi:3-methyladenine DNA glycosylase AlkD
MMNEDLMGDLMALNDTLDNIRAQLRLGMNGVAAQSMREKGLVYKLNFGVELPRIKTIAAGYEKDHALAQALWKEDIREFKILAGMLQPIDTFYHEIADIWVESIRNIEIAELTAMNLLQHLPYAPAKTFQWIADEREYVQVTGYLTIARLLMKKGDMTERASSELLDQAITAALSGGYHVRNAALSVLRKYMQYSEGNAFGVCRMVECYAESENETERMLYDVVKEEAENF